ncbi:hypothetical protein Maes01_02273 [Microbulbifer aestuariivivens]|uniref:Lipoprotein n=1 Tax=Microbulbifer aestuariivivens TaxID=1908308 RepID=A0ABP9WUI7_9GAMM
MSRMYRYLSLIALLMPLALFGCGQKTDTNDPANAEVVEEDIEVTEPSQDGGTPGDTTDSATGDDTTGDSASAEDSQSSEGQTCTPEWFEWVQAQVVAIPGADAMIAEWYGDGMPEVGSDDWYVAMDRLTGGDGAHGPDGGSAEWCSMMEQRLGNLGSQ